MKESKDYKCKPFDEYLNICDDFKTNLVWLSVFIPTIEGIGMRLPVNYRQVMQWNFFEGINKDKPISETVYQSNGDTFQNSPIKLVFFTVLHNPGITQLKLDSISQVNVNLSYISNKDSSKEESSEQDASLPNMTITNDNMQCMWPQQTDLQDFLFVLGYHPYKNLGTGQHDFPWNCILSLFNNEDMKKPLAFKARLELMDFDFLYDDADNFEQNLHRFKQFFQFISPISCSATEGNHRIEVANRLLYGVHLKQEAPFLKTEPSFLPLPYNSTVFKPISASVYLPRQNGPSLSTEITSHMQTLSRKIANQKDLYIKDSWHSLYQSIYSAIDNDQDFFNSLYITQAELYQDSLKSRQETDHKARIIRTRLGKLIAHVIFKENPTATLATKSNNPIPTLEKWLIEMEASTWTAMDNNPFAAVSLQKLLIL